MKQLTINTASKTYPVFVGKDVLDYLGEFMQTELDEISKVWVIADEQVAGLYLQELLDAIVPYYKEKVVTTIVPSGEKAKSFSVFEFCHKEGLEHEINRNSVVLAFGGGAIGDLAGFVAATYMRGIRFIGIPTTLLAHDSAVGGKTAINHPLGKNMVGAFHQPEAVFYNWRFISSLSERELRSGFAEAVKHGLILDKDFYLKLLDDVQDISDLHGDLLEHIIMKGIAIKESIVSQDEMEKGVRAFLNFGHTLGHSIEANAGYGNVTHGEAVWTGMWFALQISMDKLGLAFDLGQFEQWSAKLGYRLDLPQCSHEDLLESMKKDKKTTGENITFVLLKKVGEPVTLSLTKEEVLDSLKRYFD